MERYQTKQVMLEGLGEPLKARLLPIKLGAFVHHIFLLVPTGRGKYISDCEISSEEYEKILNWFYKQGEKTPLQLNATCAPHYYRISGNFLTQEPLCDYQPGRKQKSHHILYPNS